MHLVYPAVFYPCEVNPGFTVVVPDLPGCISEGNSLANAIAMGEDAASGWILGELEDGNTVPPASNISAIHPDPEIGDGFVSLLSLDMDAYAAKYGNKSVRKNLTIPAWLNTFAETEKLNVSKVLQQALTTLYEKKTAIVCVNLRASQFTTSFSNHSPESGYRFVITKWRHDSLPPSLHRPRLDNKALLSFTHTAPSVVDSPRFAV